MNKIVLVLASFLISTALFSQSASVSPSRLYFDVSPGEYKSKTIRVTNNGKSKESFKVSFIDFNSPGSEGKTKLDSSGSQHGCSEWLTASPSFFELEAGESKEVEVLLQVPNIPEANTVRWAAASVKIARENKEFDKGADVKSAMQIVQTFQFIIHIFQTPPNVTFKEAVINSFERTKPVEIKTTDSTATQDIALKMTVENTGDAIIDCAPYIDLINLDNGDERRVKQKGFTVLPGGVRTIVFTIPNDLPKGNYSALGIVDYGSNTDLAAYEIDLKIE